MKTLAGRRPYRVLWLAGFVHWLAVLQGVRLRIGRRTSGGSRWRRTWRFICRCSSRCCTAVHRLKVPLLAAAPVVWTGLEYARGGVFRHGLLARAIGTHAGAVDAAHPGFGPRRRVRGELPDDVRRRRAGERHACGSLTAPRERQQWRWGPIAAALLLVVASIAYGGYRTSQPAEDRARPPLKAALVQAWVDTIFEYDPERDLENFEIYADLSRQAAREHPDLDVVILARVGLHRYRPLRDAR